MSAPLLPLVDYAERGPYPVGVVSLELIDAEDPGRTVPTDVWYPADPASADATPRADHPIGGLHEAAADARPAKLPSPLPIVAFSHGNSGFRRQSTFLTSHLASWGLLVTAPDHTGNTFFEMIGIKDEDERIRIHKRARNDRPRDLGSSIDAVLDPPAGLEAAWPAANEERIGVLGHSYGGWTALKMPRRDDRIRAVCGLAPASEAFVGKRAFETDELPFAAEIPSLLVPALDDVLVDLEASVRPLFHRLAAPAALVGVADADHFHFCDRLPLLHELHEKNQRPKQTRATRPYAELLGEARAQRLLRGLVTAFFLSTLADEPVMPDLSAESLGSLDPALTRLDASVRDARVSR
jgi:predicted dienelactone hydrolase